MLRRIAPPALAAAFVLPDAAGAAEPDNLVPNAHPLAPGPPRSTVPAAEHELKGGAVREIGILNAWKIG